MFTFLQIPVGGFDENFSYIVWEEERRKGALVDPTGSFAKIKEAFSPLLPPIAVEYILLTHSHKDHLSALEEAKEFFRIRKVLGHPANPFVNMPVKDGEKIPLGRGNICSIFTPGHTADSVSYLTDDFSALFTGDTLFVDYCGFAQDEDALFDSLHKRIFPLPDKIMVCSGHDYGKVPCRTLGEEKHLNPYLKAETREEFAAVMKLLE